MYTCILYMCILYMCIICTVVYIQYTRVLCILYTAVCIPYSVQSLLGFGMEGIQVRMSYFFEPSGDKTNVLVISSMNRLN